MWVAVVMLVLAGCSEDPEPVIEPPAETTPASDPSPTATPEAKEPWEKKTKAGAVAFAEHWIDVFSAALQTSQTADLQQISSPECESCGAAIQRIKRIESEGGFYRTPGWRVLEATPSSRMRPPEVAVAMDIHRGREVYKNDADSEVERNPASRAAFSAEVVWTEGGWLMAELSLVS